MDSFIFFPSLIAVASTSKTMLNYSGEKDFLGDLLAKTLQSQFRGLVSGPDPWSGN